MRRRAGLEALFWALLSSREQVREEQPEELWPIPPSAGRLLAEDALTPNRVQRRYLSRRVLLQLRAGDFRMDGL